MFRVRQGAVIEDNDEEYGYGSYAYAATNAGLKNFNRLTLKDNGIDSDIEEDIEGAAGGSVEQQSDDDSDQDPELKLLDCSKKNFLEWNKRRDKERFSRREDIKFKLDPDNYPENDDEYEVECIVKDWTGKSDRGIEDIFYLVKFKGFEIPSEEEQNKRNRGWLHPVAMRKEESKKILQDYINESMARPKNRTRGWEWEPESDSDSPKSGPSRETETQEVGDRKSRAARPKAFIGTKRPKLKKEPKKESNAHLIEGLTPSRILGSYLDVPSKEECEKEDREDDERYREDLKTKMGLKGTVRATPDPEPEPEVKYYDSDSDDEVGAIQPDGLVYHCVVYETPHGNYAQMLSDVTCRKNWPEVVERYHEECREKKRLKKEQQRKDDEDRERKRIKNEKKRMKEKKQKENRAESANEQSKDE